MTLEEKVEKLVSRVLPDTLSESDAESYIESSKWVILNKMYPFGVPEPPPDPPEPPYTECVQCCLNPLPTPTDEEETEEIDVPACYEQLQLQIALELFTRKGAEGQTYYASDRETWQWGDSFLSQSLLKQVIPHCSAPKVKMKHQPIPPCWFPPFECPKHSQEDSNETTE